MSDIAARLTTFSEGCWRRGRELSSLAMRKLFEKPDEAYHQWNSSLPGYVPPHPEIGRPLTSAPELRAAMERVTARRERLRAEMIARQEEMDWLVYEAYGLISDCGLVIADSDLMLAREERPFCLWARAQRDFDTAVALIPQGWSYQRKALWKARLQMIRDNEHIRRIEQPMYKRRWEEQWKVGNRWQCGQPAYDAEFLDAFHWWLSEKAEWWLETQRGGGPVTLDEWASVLWSDPRVQAAWPVAAEACQRLDQWKKAKVASASTLLEIAASGSTLASGGRRHPGADLTQPLFGESMALQPAPQEFACSFRTLVRDQTLPENIPFGVSWKDLEKKLPNVPASAKRIRGKLNVPRERFWVTRDSLYRVAKPI
jgi:hypothetical protein